MTPLASGGAAASERSGLLGLSPAVTTSRILLLSPHYPPDASGIGDYTHFLANALARLGCTVEIITSVGPRDEDSYPLEQQVRVHRTLRRWGVLAVWHVLRALRALPRAALLIQYAPHAYARRGIAFGPALLIVAVRFLTRHRVIVNFHEIAIPFSRSWKFILGALWQRGMAALIGTAAHALSAPTGQWRELLHSLGVRKPVTLIPVGSNIPLAPLDDAERLALRKALGVERGLLVGCFGSLHGRDERLAVEAFASLRRRRGTTVVWLGEAGRSPSEPDSTDIVWTGRLSHQELSRHLSACDLFVLPFRDGVSTRRTTLAAALLHGLPVLTTRGPATDELFLTAATMVLTPAGDTNAFVAALDRLADDAELRRRLADAARAFYASHLAWDTVARRVSELALPLRPSV